MQGVLGGGETPFSPHDFFSIFSFSRHNEALHRHARKYFSVKPLLPIIAHMLLASLNNNLPPTIISSTPHHPFPTTPITQSVEEFSYTDLLRFSIFRGGYLDHCYGSLGRIFAEVSYCISLQLPGILGELNLHLQDDFKKNSKSRLGGKTLDPKNFGVEYLVNGERFDVEIRSAYSASRLLWALWVYIFSRHNCIFGDFSKI